MKRLAILRHAHAGFGSETSDFDRSLSEEGKAHAMDIGRYLQKQDDTPDYVLCSAALRTRETVSALLPALTECETVYDEKLYMSSAGQLYDVIKSIDNSYAYCLVTGHNPSIHQIANFLLGKADDGCAEKVAYAYPAGTLSIFECDIERWADLMPGENVLKTVLTRQEL
jgi:phosphohistidine phosphatase